MDLPRHFAERERHHRIHDPIDAVKLAALGAALRLPAGATVLDLACGSGEMLCTWARDHGFRGTGVDLSSVFVASARERAAEFGVSDGVRFVHGDAAGYVADEPVDVASCLGATWIGGGMEGTVALLRRSARPGGMLLVGEPYWRRTPDDAALASFGVARDEWTDLPSLLTRFDELGCDLVEMVLADPDSWDRYVAAQWLTMRRFVDEHPDDELTPQFREELATAPLHHVRYQREHLGWGVFVLMDR
jgi:SAM-dependent methyltransferase